MNRQQAVAKCLILFAQSWPGRFEAAEGSVAAWSAVLGDQTPEAIFRAGVRLSRESIHPPSVALLRKAAISGPCWDGSMSDDFSIGDLKEPDLDAAVRALGSLLGGVEGPALPPANGGARRLT